MKSKLNLIFTMLSAVLMAACSTHIENFRLTGSVSGTDSLIILVTGIDSRFDRVDTIFVKDGAFSYECDVDTITPLLLLYPDGSSDVVFADKLQETSLKRDSAGTYAYVEGGSCNAEYMEFMSSIAGDTSITQIISRIDTLVKNSPDSEIIPVLIYRYCIRNDQIEGSNTKEILDRISGNLHDIPFISDLQEYLKDVYRSRNFSGKGYIDTAFNPVNIREIYKDETVLFYFWTSWDMNRQGTIAEMRKLEEDFADRKFRIAGISLDTERGRWKDTLLSDSIKWDQYADLSGWDNECFHQYGRNHLPFFVLVNTSTGSILKEGSSIEKLRPQIESLDTKKGKDRKKKK